MRIYDMGETARQVIAALEMADELCDESGGVVTPEAEALMAEADDLLTGLTEHLREHADDVARVLLEARTRADARREHTRRAQARAQRAERTVERLTSAVLLAMQAAGFDRLGREHTLRVQANGGAAPLLIEGEVPHAWRKPGDPDTSRIRSALAEGVELTFARLGERGVGLRVK